MMIPTIVGFVNTQPLAVVGHFAEVHPEGPDVSKKANPLWHCWKNHIT